MVARNPDRSLMPPPGATQPFVWDQGSTEAQTSLDERVRTVRAQPLPEPTLRSLRLWFRTQHVYHSNAIEGSTLTLYETQVVIGDGLTVGGKPLRDVLAAKNLATALDWVEEIGQGSEPLNERIVREIHALIMRGEDDVLPGQYKRENNRVAGAEFRTPSHLQTAPLMESLGAFLSGPPAADPVGSSAVVHAWLVGIHPFRDGNGRTARLVANLVLIRNGYPVALLSEGRRPEYYAALDKAHCTGDLTDFLRLWRECVGVTLTEYERMMGAIEVREREVEYMASAVKLFQSSTDHILRQWQGAIGDLAAELQSVATALNEKLEVDAGQVTVTASSVTASLLAQARNGMAPVIALSGELQGRPFSSRISLGTTETADGRVALHVDAPPRPSARDQLVGLRLDGSRVTFVWKRPDGSESQEADKTLTEAATVIFKEAFERTSAQPAPTRSPTSGPC